MNYTHNDADKPIHAVAPEDLLDFERHMADDEVPELQCPVCEERFNRWQATNPEQPPQASGRTK